MISRFKTLCGYLIIVWNIYFVWQSIHQNRLFGTPATSFIFSLYSYIYIHYIFFKNNAGVKQVGGNVISINGPVNWPPRLCDFTPPVYFLWGYIKFMVCTDKPTTLEALKVNINRAINEIRPEILEKRSKSELIGNAS